MLITTQKKVMTLVIVMASTLLLISPNQAKVSRIAEFMLAEIKHELDFTEASRGINS